MWKLCILTTVITAAVAQIDPQMMMMMNMMNTGGSSSASGTGSTLTTGQTRTEASGTGGMMGSGGMMSFMNNPALLCRNTEGFRMIPCQQWRGICDIIGMQTYNMPNVLTCSTLGIGCCIKDYMTYLLLQRLG